MRIPEPQMQMGGVAGGGGQTEVYWDSPNPEESGQSTTKGVSCSVECGEVYFQQPKGLSAQVGTQYGQKAKSEKSKGVPTPQDVLQQFKDESQILQVNTSRQDGNPGKGDKEMAH